VHCEKESDCQQKSVAREAEPHHLDVIGGRNCGWRGAIMSTLAFVSVLVGVILGLGLTYRALIPAAAVLLVAVAGAAIVRRSGIEWAMLRMVLGATALQAGYLCGAAIRSILAAAQLNGSNHQTDRTKRSALD